MGLTSRQLGDIEKGHPEGLSSKEILRVLDEHGEPLSEATLRKYVQLGLLPRSRRVGQKGKHRGSRGIYPVEVVRRIDEIRRAMGQGETLEELAKAAQAVRAKLSSVRVALEEAIEAADTDFAGRDLDRKAKSELRAELAGLKRGAKDWMKSMDRWMADLEQAERARAKAEGRNGKSSTRSNGHVARGSTKKTAARATKKKAVAKKTSARKAPSKSAKAAKSSSSRATKAKRATKTTRSRRGAQ